MLDFPATPTLNQQFSSGTSTWQWLRKVFPNLSANNHPDHSTANAIVSSDQSMRPPSIDADRPHLIVGEFVPAVALVGALLFAGRPTTVFRRIAESIIVALKRPVVFRAIRSRPHVGDEISELTPPLTNGDASTAIVFVAGLSRVIAATKHAVPYGVFCWSHTEQRSMGSGV